MVANLHILKLVQTNVYRQKIYIHFIMVKCILYYHCLYHKVSL